MPLLFAYSPTALLVSMVRIIFSRLGFPMWVGFSPRISTRFCRLSEDRERMWKLATVNSKVSFLLLSMVGIPAMFEMPELLKLWLGDVPQNTVYFGCTFLMMQTVDQWSGGLGLANRAMGNIGKYTLVTYTPKLLVVPLSFVVLKQHMATRSIARWVWQQQSAIW